MDPNQMKIGAYALPFILTAILSFVYALTDPDVIPNVWKKLIPVIVGISLTLLSFYQINPLLTLDMIINGVIMGFLLGTSSIGINQLGKGRDDVLKCGKPIPDAKPT